MVPRRRIIPHTDFGDFLTVPLVHEADVCFLVKSQQLSNWFPWNLVQTFMMPRGWILVTDESVTNQQDKFSLIQWNISTSTSCIGINVCADAHGAQRMNPTDFGDVLTFHVVPSWGCYFFFFSEISQQLFNGLMWNLAQTFMFPSGWIHLWAFNFPSITIIRSSFNLSNNLVYNKISAKTTEWIATKVGTVNNFLLQMNCNIFGDPIFSSSGGARWWFIIKYLQEWGPFSRSCTFWLVPVNKC